MGGKKKEKDMWLELKLCSLIVMHNESEQSKDLFDGSMLSF